MGRPEFRLNRMLLKTEYTASLSRVIYITELESWPKTLKILPNKDQKPAELKPPEYRKLSPRNTLPAQMAHQSLNTAEKN